MTTDEALSRLLSGDLPDHEARALHARIEAEPELAASWAELQDLVEELDDLPDALTPPPLDPRVLGGAAEPRSRSPLWSAVPWLAAAAAAMLWLWPAPGVERVLLEGSEWVEGEVTVYAADAVIELDGTARILVEPAGGAVRVPGPEQERTMDRKQILAGLAGAVVTVAVYQGTAVVRAATSSVPVSVQAGETHTVGVAPRRAAPRAVGTVSAPADRVAELEAELEAARQELAEAKFTNAIARGQLVAHQGTASPWPDDVPAAMTPEHFEAELVERLTALPDVEITRIDCGEYPCVAALRYNGDVLDDDWSDPLDEVVGTFARDVLGEDDLSLSTNHSRFSNNGREARFVIFGAHTGGRDSDVGTRTKYRVDEFIDTIGEEVNEEWETQE